MTVDITDPEAATGGTYTMAQIPKNATNFKGDQDQSFTLWIQIVEAQMTVLGTRGDKKLDTLLYLLESSEICQCNVCDCCNDGLRDFLREKYCV